MDRPPPNKRGVRQSRFKPQDVAELLMTYAKTTNNPSVRHFCLTHRGQVPCRKILRKWELTHSGVMRALGMMRYLSEVDSGRAA
jgi:hypothetical protein